MEDDYLWDDKMEKENYFYGAEEIFFNISLYKLNFLKSNCNMIYLNIYIL